MDVTVKYFNIMRDVAGQPQEVLHLSAEATVAEALAAVSQRYGKAMSRLVWAPDGRKSVYLSLFLNGHRLTEKELQVTLSAGAELMLMPAIAGG